jgi:hypothetical protein
MEKDRLDWKLSFLSFNRVYFKVFSSFVYLKLSRVFYSLKLRKESFLYFCVYYFLTTTGLLN